MLVNEELKIIRGIAKEQIVDFNFEDERIRFESGELDLILQAWQERNPKRNLENARFFLDMVNQYSVENVSSIALMKPGKKNLQEQ